MPGASSERNCALIRKTIRTVLALERVALPCEVDVLFTDDEGIHAINLEMRGVDMPTDVLSFPEFEFTPGCPPEDAALRRGHRPSAAGRYGTEYGAGVCPGKGIRTPNRRELAYLVTHSVLHLLGYDHLDEGEQKRQMRAREEAIMEELGIGRKAKR